MAAEAAVHGCAKVQYCARPVRIGFRACFASADLETKGDCFAKAHISTAQETPGQDARVSFAHEVGRRPEGSCGTPQEGTPSPYARVKRGRKLRAARPPATPANLPRRTS